MKFFKYTLFVAISALFVACAAPLDRSVVPMPAAAPTIQLGDYDTFTLDNGLKVIVVQNNKLPRVSYQLTVDRDPIFEGDKAGYVSMAGDLLKKGTTSKSKAEIDQAVDFIGADLSTYSNGAYGAALTKHTDALLALMSDIVLNPAFPQDELDKLKKQTISGLASATTDANSISGNISNAMCYGLDHPYGEPQTEKTTEAVTRNDLVNYYSTFFRPNISYLTIVGDITPEAAKAQAEKYFGAWEKAEVPSMSYDKPALPEGNKVCFAPLSGAVQSVINVTFPVDLTPGSEDAIAASVMNSVLGGGVFGGRLMQNLREDKAFTYGARSSLSSDPVIGSFSAYASVRNEVTDSSIVEFLYEIDRLASEPIEDSTLQFIKNNMTGSFARSLESPQTIARFALNIERYGLPKDYYATYLSKLEAVSKEDVLRVARQFLRSENAYITVVGNKEEVAEKLERFSYDGKVKFLDIYGRDYVDLAPAPEGMTGKDVVLNYVKAIGGVDALAKVKSTSMSGEMDMGQVINMTQKTKDNRMLSMEMSMGGMVVMQQVFDGEAGMVSQMGQKVPMGEDEVASMKKQADLLYEAKLDDYGTTAELKGIGSFDEKPAYVVELTEKDGTVSTVYFSVDSGLKMFETSTESTPQGDMVIATTYKEYLEVKGVKFPKVISQTVGPQSFVITYNEILVNPKLKNSDFSVN